MTRTCSRCTRPALPTLAHARNGFTTRRTLVSSCCAAQMAGVSELVTARVKAVLARTPVVPYVSLPDVD